MLYQSHVFVSFGFETLAFGCAKVLFA
jgi:hypothetical protein